MSNKSYSPRSLVNSNRQSFTLSYRNAIYTEHHVFMYCDRVLILFAVSESHIKPSHPMINQSYS